jgi:hypothetical protein
MALKPDRRHNEFDIDVTRFFDDIDNGGERGGVAVRAASATPSGASMDQTTNAVHYAADPSGRLPVGMLLVDVVDFDLTKQPLNTYQSQEQVGGKVPIARKGRWVTNMIHPDATGIAAGDVAYLAASGLISNISGSGRPEVGEWDTSPDEDGYAALILNL